MKNVLIAITLLLLAGLSFACAGSYEAQKADYSYNDGYSRGPSGGAPAAPAASPGSYDVEEDAAPRDYEVAATESGGSAVGNFLDGLFGDELNAKPTADPSPVVAQPRPDKVPVKVEGGDKTAPTGTEQKPPDDGTPDPPTQRIIIYVADLGLFVFNVEETITKATNLVKELGGWIQTSTSTSLTIRVPAQNFEMVLKELSTLGDVSYKNVVGSDVTEEFYDLAIRLKNAQALRDRYIELLKKAATVEDNLKIEAELRRITEEIDRLKGRLKFLSQHAAFSTINLTIQKKSDEPPRVTRIPLPFYWLQSYRVEGVLY